MGARVWIARIMITWGIISSAMMFTTSPAVFYVLRFFLGVAEAGFFPGMVFYLTNWFPAVQRARAISRFMMAIPIAGVIGNPLGGLLLGLNGKAGLAGWQWLFLLEGIPSILLGFVTLFYLTDRPDQAKWLYRHESEYLIERLRKEHEIKQERHSLNLLQAFCNPRVLLLCLLYFCIVVGGYGLTLNLPSIVASLGKQSSAATGLISAIPNICAAIAMIVVGLHSDRTRERRWHVAGSCFVGAIGLTMTALLHDPIPGLIGLCLASLGQASTLAPFWALTTSFLSGVAAAGGIAFINSVGNLGGYIGPMIMGKIKDQTGSFSVALLTLSGILAVAGILSILVRHDPTLEHPSEEVELQLEIAETS
jgi:ACS family tartrate transporter-like MFS transporter